jgi:RAB protein geranylgeranyltransferase component A
MTHFLLVYDRAEGRVLREEPFNNHRDALVARFEAERLHRGNDDIEVVVLSAESSEAIRKTHARYFQTIGEIAASGLAWMREQEARRAAQ